MALQRWRAAMPSRVVLYAGNDQLVSLLGVTDQNGNPITVATISGNIVNSRGTAASLVFSAVAGSPGNFTAPLGAANVPPLGSYLLEIAGQSNGTTLALQVPCAVISRTL